MKSEKNYSWLKRLLLALITVLAGKLVIGFISFQLQVGPITFIIGDHAKVENGGQTQTVFQPATPIAAEAQSWSTTSQVLDTVPAQSDQPVSFSTSISTQLPIRRAAHAEYYSQEEDCTCPDEDDEEEESEPPPQQFYQQPQQFQHQRMYYPALYSDGVSTIQTQSQNNGVSVQSNSSSVSVSTSVVNGQSHRRIVVNGQVFVDQ